MKLNFEIEVDPLPQPRPRFGRGRVYESARITAYKRGVKVAALLAMAGNPPTSNAVSIDLTFCRKFRPTSRRFGDADNLSKAVLDALTGVVWRDDVQVVRVCIVKRQASTPCVKVEITNDAGN